MLWTQIEESFVSLRAFLQCRFRHNIMIENVLNCSEGERAHKTKIFTDALGILTLSSENQCFALTGDRTQVGRSDAECRLAALLPTLLMLKNKVMQ